MTDDGGVLGNLPRSRPGQRSEKRTAAKAAPAAGAAKRPRSAARTPGAPKPPKSAPRKAAPASESRDAQPAAHAGDPVGDAIRTVTGVAATGARVAGGVAREVLRRLPRP
jgi:hypothetical protein